MRRSASSSSHHQQAPRPACSSFANAEPQGLRLVLVIAKPSPKSGASGASAAGVLDDGARRLARGFDEAAPMGHHATTCGATTRAVRLQTARARAASCASDELAIVSKLQSVPKRRRPRRVDREPGRSRITRTEAVSSQRAARKIRTTCVVRSPSTPTFACEAHFAWLFVHASNLRHCVTNTAVLNPRA